MNRGGSWANDAENCRSAYRNGNEPANRNENLGFRVAAAPRKRRMPSRAEQAAVRSRLGAGKIPSLGRPVLVANGRTLGAALFCP